MLCQCSWRHVCRPLADELVEYARTDVHFLLYVANVLRAELAAKGESVLQDACRRSHAMAVTLYIKPTAQVNTNTMLPQSTQCWYVR